jgi:hypothetical protein
MLPEAPISRKIPHRPKTYREGESALGATGEVARTLLSSLVGTAVSCPVQVGYPDRQRLFRLLIVPYLSILCHVKI